MKITDIYYFSSTHWDREWYQSFQGFRTRLVDMVDDMIDYLEDNQEFGVFHFDGQTIVLDDYAAIAPENSERLKTLIKNNRIKIGPWYDMPDEFLLSGESLIRNLIKGHKIATDWETEAWKYGYVCDIFGHIAQMPQIFAGFGINHALLGRGVTDKTRSFFIWQSPDGTQCTTYAVDPVEGYGSVFCHMFKSLPEDPSDNEIKECLKNIIEAEIRRTNSPVIILADGADHREIIKNVPRYIDFIKELYPDVNVHHCDLTEANEKINSFKDMYPVFKGELNKTAENSSGFLRLITNTLSSYYTHKKANDECQYLLEKWLEPMMAFSALYGDRTRRSYIDLAYDYLLKNHPHDSICGCSIDQVHKDMIYRFDQVKEIDEALTEKFLYKFGPEQGESSEYVLRIYNPLSYRRKECVKAEVVLGRDFTHKFSETFDYEEIFSFRIIDDRGNEIPYERVSVTKNFLKRTYENKSIEGEAYYVSFMADMPACGYTEYKIVPSNKPVRYIKKMKSGSNYAENEFVRVCINQYGQIDIYDKITGNEYKNLAWLEDDGEIGDGWTHVNSVNDAVSYSDSIPARIEKTENGPSRCVFRVTKYIEVPECMVKNHFGWVRSDKYVRLPVIMEVGLSEGARFADVSLTINNLAKDHRIKLVIPTGIFNDKYFAGQTYYCNERRTGVDYSTQDWYEPEQYEKQMNGIVGKRDENENGIAFVSAEGIHECSSYEDDRLSVTLLRAFTKTFITMGENNGNLIGELNYRFLLVPLDKDVTYSKLVKMQDILGTKQVTTCTRVKDDYKVSQKSIMEVIGENINVSIIKSPENREENTLIVRLCNLSNDVATGFISFEKTVENAFITNLNEEVTENVEVSSNKVPVSLDVWKIKTYKIILKK